MNMEEVLHILNEYWPLLLALVAVLAKIANVTTKHWPEWGPKLKWIGLLVEVLDVFRIPQIKKPQAEGPVPAKDAQEVAEVVRDPAVY